MSTLIDPRSPLIVHSARVEQGFIATLCQSVVLQVQHADSVWQYDEYGGCDEVTCEECLALLPARGRIVQFDDLEPGDPYWITVAGRPTANVFPVVFERVIYSKFRRFPVWSFLQRLPGGVMLQHGYIGKHILSIEKRTEGEE